MNAFAQMATEWANFFGALAQVSGGLAGLVFVALTFNARTLGEGGDPMLGALARQTFGDFVVVLLISLIMLVPHASMWNAGAVFLASSALAVLRIVRSLLRVRGQLRHPSGGWEVMQRFVLSALGHGMIAAVGVELLRGNTAPDLTGSLLFGGVIMLLLSGCRSAWLLVVTGMR